MDIAPLFRQFISVTFLASSLLLITACGGGGGGSDDDAPAPSTPAATYSIGGAVTGLKSGASLILRNNGGDALTVSSSGTFTFATALTASSAYNVAAASQPANQTCSISYGTGTTTSANVTNVAVSCVNTVNAVDPNGANTLSPTHKPTLIGVVIDSAVINLHYDAPTLDGTTNNQGQFSYLPGDMITFKIGDIALPAVTGQPLVTLYNFAGTNDINSTVLVNIARFLQSLDSDSNPENGISIPEAAHTAATGQSVDFGSASFDAQAAPIIAGAIPGRTLISGSAAIAHVQSTLENLPKLAPIAGAWTTGTGINVRAVILLENGFYYGIDGNCGSRPGYEFGSWAYNGSLLTLAVSADANGSCGMNTGSRTASITGNSLTLDGAAWTDVSYATSGLSGLYVHKGFINGADEVALTLLTDTQYLTLDIEDVRTQVTVGTYTWGGNTSPSATFTPLASLTPESVFVTDILREQSLLVAQEPGFPINMEVAVRPARIANTLPGFWYFDDEGDVTSADLVYPLVFTSDGKYMYLGNDPACPGLVRSAAGEYGSYAWDAVTGAFSLSIAGDSNGVCGIADENFVTSATVTGNLLNFGSSTGAGTFVKPSGPAFTDPNQNSAVGIWKQTTGSGALTLLIHQTNANLLTIRALDSNCPTAGTSYAVESLNAAVSAPANIVQTTASTNYDTAGCGLPTTLGPTYSVVGDTLTIDGLGTFVRAI